MISKIVLVSIAMIYSALATPNKNQILSNNYINNIHNPDIRLSDTFHSENQRNLEDIINNVNKIIDERLNDSKCSNEQKNNFTNFAHNRISSMNLKQLNKSFDFVIDNLKAQLETFKKQNCSFKNNEIDGFIDFQEKSNFFTNEHPDDWPPSPLGRIKK